jgi:hypothetical protein
MVDTYVFILQNRRTLMFIEQKLTESQFSPEKSKILEIYKLNKQLTGHYFIICIVPQCVQHLIQKFITLINYIKVFKEKMIKNLITYIVFAS